MKGPYPRKMCAMRGKGHRHTGEISIVHKKVKTILLKHTEISGAIDGGFPFVLG